MSQLIRFICSPVETKIMFVFFGACAFCLLAEAVLLIKFIVHLFS